MSRKKETTHKPDLMYSKTYLKQSRLKRPNIGFQDQILFNAGQKYCRMLQGEHSAILLTFIKLPFVIKIFCFIYFGVAVLHRFYCIVSPYWFPALVPLFKFGEPILDFFNPFHSDGLSQVNWYNKYGDSLFCTLWTHRSNFLNYDIFMSQKIGFILANSADTDEMSPYAAFNLGLHCLLTYLFTGTQNEKD